MATLAEIRAKLQAQETRTTGGSGGDNAIYPHWNISEGTTAIQDSSDPKPATHFSGPNEQ